ncbi:hypothetical protein Tco_1398571, partial [Tanacetum coccineum]
HNRVIHVRGGVLVESSQSSESSIGVSFTTCGSNVHSTTGHNDFEHFKIGLPVTLRIDQSIVKRHDKTPYEISRERIPDISYFYVFGCPVFIHNHKDHLGKFDAKADDGYFVGYYNLGLLTTT